MAHWLGLENTQQAVKKFGTLSAWSAYKLKLATRELPEQGRIQDFQMGVGWDSTVYVHAYAVHNHKRQAPPPNK